MKTVKRNIFPIRMKNIFTKKPIALLLLVLLFLFHIPLQAQVLEENDLFAKDSTVKLTNVSTYVKMIGFNLKEAFTKPFHLSKSETNQLTDFTFLIIGLRMLDEPVQRSPLNLKKSNSGLSDASHFVSKFGAEYQIITLAALGTYGLIFKDEKLKNTTLLATQALITAGAVGTVIKTLTGRDRPSYYGKDETASPTFQGPGEKSYSSSFPSGHTFSAFAVATVYATEYKDKPFVPILAYSAASLVGLSRISENKHWTTDVLVGAVLGYLSGKQAVNNYHFLQTKKKSKLNYSFQLNYSAGQWNPSVVVLLP